MKFRQCKLEYKKMRSVIIVALFAVSSVLSYLDFANGLWISTISKASDKTEVQDEFDEPPPIAFPPFPIRFFLNFFHPQTMNHERYFPNAVKKIKDVKVSNSSFLHKGERSKEISGTNATVSSFMQHAQKVEDFEKLKTGIPAYSKSLEGVFMTEDSNSNVSLQSKSDNVKELQSTAVAHHVVKKFMERTSKPSFFQRIFDPLSRLRRFHYFYARNLGRDQKNNTREGELSIVEPSININGNATKVPVWMSQTSNEKNNCSTMHFISRYIFFWRINWNSVILQILFILLVAAMVSTGVFLCQYFSSGEQAKNSYIVKELTKPAKPLHV